MLPSTDMIISLFKFSLDLYYLFIADENLNMLQRVYLKKLMLCLIDMIKQLTTLNSQICSVNMLIWVAH